MWAFPRPSILNCHSSFNRPKLDGKVNKIRKGNGDEKGLKRGERIETFPHLVSWLF